MQTVPGPKFCVDCGTALSRLWDALDETERHTCRNCGYTHYDSPKILVWCLAHCGDRMLLCRRALAPALGLWNPPGGFVEAGETLDEAVAREFKEETGVQLPILRFSLFRVASLPHMNQVYVGFRTEFALEPILAPGQETLEARFFSENEALTEELAFRDGAWTSDIYRRLRDKDFDIHLHPPRSPLD